MRLRILSGLEAPSDRRQIEEGMKEAHNPDTNWPSARSSNLSVTQVDRTAMNANPQARIHLKLV
ncbi:hypothetical protein H351_29490 [Rhodococcus erythropolis R138]|nr:hypothetical protein H351_29490 [Rhodococcus erythropolis R138]